MVKSLSSILTSSAAAIDPALDALFTTSAAPAKPAQQILNAPHQAAKASPKSNEPDLSASEEESPEDGESDVASKSSDDDEGESEYETAEDTPAPNKSTAKDVGQAATENLRAERKRKRKDPTEDIEGRHLRKLRDEDDERSSKRKKAVEPSKEEAKQPSEDSDDDDDDDDSDGGANLVHESLAQEAQDTDLDKADRTVFLANVSTEAISSKAAKRTLEKHLESVLDKSASPAEKIESIRFRSLAVSSLALPKRAAYITKSLMDTTTKSCNAYVVYSTAAAARKAVSKLNATQVLERHLRVDGVKHPSATDHRRCVFVGNLGFVDDETVMNTDAEGNTTSKKRYKVPSDIEEGLWRVFTQKAGKVESVRVVRDPKTRVGKGFAYVQFYDGNHVEAALLLDGKKFTPMLPRPLRVTRAKNPRSTAQALQKRGIRPSSAPSLGHDKKKSGPKENSVSRRDTKLLGVAGAARQARGKETHASKEAHANKGVRTPEHIIFEGKRAAAGDVDGLRKRHKAKKSGTAKRLKGKRAQRVKEWKKAGGKKTQ